MCSLLSRSPAPVLILPPRGLVVTAAWHGRWFVHCALVPLPVTQFPVCCGRVKRRPPTASPPQQSPPHSSASASAAAATTTASAIRGTAIATPPLLSVSSLARADSGIDHRIMSPTVGPLAVTALPEPLVVPPSVVGSAGASGAGASGNAGHERSEGKASIPFFQRVMVTYEKAMEEEGPVVADASHFVGMSASDVAADAQSRPGACRRALRVRFLATAAVDKGCACGSRWSHVCLMPLLPLKWNSSCFCCCRLSTSWRDLRSGD